jgi:restriction system protein
MGYGGTLANAARVTKRSGDEGIDGVIDEDRLGLDSIYIQAKRWEGIVGRPEIQKFVGALSGQRATKGVFITTSDFTKEALDFVKNNNHYKVVLINGFTLAKLMIENNVGVSIATTYEVKSIDSDFFVDE